MELKRLILFVPYFCTPINIYIQICVHAIYYTSILIIILLKFISKSHFLFAVFLTKKSKTICYNTQYKDSHICNDQQYNISQIHEQSSLQPTRTEINKIHKYMNKVHCSQEKQKYNGRNDWLFRITACFFSAPLFTWLSVTSTPIFLCFPYVCCFVQENRAAGEASTKPSLRRTLSSQWHSRSLGWKGGRKLD